MSLFMYEPMKNEYEFIEFKAGIHFMKYNGNLILAQTVPTRANSIHD